MIQLLHTFINMKWPAHTWSKSFFTNLFTLHDFQSSGHSAAALIASRCCSLLHHSDPAGYLACYLSVWVCDSVRLSLAAWVASPRCSPLTIQVRQVDDYLKNLGHKPVGDWPVGVGLKLCRMNKAKEDPWRQRGVQIRTHIYIPLWFDVQPYRSMHQ